MSIVEKILLDERCLVYSSTLRRWESVIDSLPWRDCISDAEVEAFLRSCAFSRSQEQAEFVISRLGAPGGSEAGVIVLGLEQGKSGAFMDVSDVAERLLLKKPPVLDLSPTDPRVVGLRMESFACDAFVRYYEKVRGVKLSRLDLSDEIRNPDLVDPYVSTPDDVFMIEGTGKVVVVDYKSPSYTHGSLELFNERSGYPASFEYRAQIQLYSHAVERLGYDVEDRVIFNFGFEGAPGVLQSFAIMRQSPSFDSLRESLDALDGEIRDRIACDIDTERYDFCRYSMSSFQRDDLLFRRIISCGERLMGEYVMEGRVPRLRPVVPDGEKKAAARSVLARYKLAKSMQNRYAAIVKDLSLGAGAIGTIKSDLGSIKVSRKLNQSEALRALERVGFDVDSIVSEERQEPRVRRHVDDVALENALVKSGLDPELFMSETTRVMPSRARASRPTWELVDNVGVSLASSAYEQALAEVSSELSMPELRDSSSVEHRHDDDSGSVPEMV